MPYDNPGELFDMVDPDDRVIGQVTRGEVHARGLLHRAAHVFVFNSNEYTALFSATCDGSPRADPTEVAELQWATVDQWHRARVDDPERLDPPFRELLRWYVAAVG